MKKSKGGIVTNDTFFYVGGDNDPEISVEINIPKFQLGMEALSKALRKVGELRYIADVMDRNEED